MDDEPDFTMGDLLQQLAGEFGYSVDNQNSEDSYTSTELSEMLGISNYRVMKKLKEMYRDGKIETVTKIITCFGSGRDLPVNAYRLKRGEDDGED